MVALASEAGRVIEGLSFRHLQMHPDHVQFLENLGLRCLAELADCPPEIMRECEPVAPFAFRRASIVARHVVGSAIDWSGFWSEQDIHVHWMAMTFEDGALAEEVLNRSLDSLSRDFGALLNIPRALGLRTLGDIVAVYEEGCDAWRGFGAIKVTRLGETLQQIAEHRMSLSDDESGAMHSSSAPEAHPSFPPEVLAWDIDALGLGAGSEKLRRHGFNTLESLLVEQSVLWRLPGVGRRTIALANSRLSLLAQATADGVVDLDRLADLEELEIFPASDRLEEGQLFEPISSVLRSLAEADPSDAALLILEHRICTGGSDEVTLEDVANMLPVRITRERVRQIEKRILQSAAELLLSPFPVMGTTIVRPVLRDKFRDLAIALETREQIGPEELALMISREWHCDLSEAVRVLPMVMAVIEGTARTFGELRRLVDSPDHYFRPLGRTGGRWSAQNIGAERGLALKLEDLNIRNLEDLRLAWIGGRDFGRHEGYVREVLNAASPEIFDEATFADRLGELTGRPVVPSERKEWSNYIRSIAEDVATVIGAGTFWSDAELIFGQRTSALPNERMTMDALGQRLGRLGVTVKKTESETLARLASAILEGREGYAQCIFRPDWLAMWSELKKIQERFPDDHRNLRRSIEQLYAFEEEAVTMAMPTIWAILTGLPSRKSFGRAKVDAQQNVPLLAPVRLAGFRTVH